MTCVAAWTNGQRLVMGADSLAARASWAAASRRDRKLFRLPHEGGPDILIGFTSSYRMGQLLMGLVPPPTMAGVEPFRWMVEAFIPAVRDRLKAGGWTRIENSREDGGEFLVGYRGCLFFVGDDFQVGESAAGFDAVGSGAEVALGALSVLDIRSDPAGAIRRALEAAEAHNAAVRGPMWIESVP